MIVHPEPSRLSRATGEERRALLEHFHRCRPCRSRLVELEGAEALFALLALDEVPAWTLSAVSAGIASDLSRPPRLRWGAASSWAASLLLGAALVAGFLARPPMPKPDETFSTPARGLRAGVAVLSSPGEARVVDLTVGETQVVMIFDSGLDL
jgi:hypothetical protein